MTRTRVRLLAAGSGVLAVLAGVAVGTAVAAVTGGPSPVVAVGNAVIALTPGFVKDFAVRAFGESDKAVLLGGMALVLLVLAAAAGVLGASRRRLAVVLVAAVGAVAVVATAVDSTTSAWPAVALLAPVATGIVAAATLLVLLRALPVSDQSLGAVPSRRPGDDLPSGFDRRRFLVAVLGTAAVAATGGAVTRIAGGSDAAVSRSRIRVPVPRSPAPPLPDGLDPLSGVTSYVTPNRDFYRVDTALIVPDVPADTWRLRIHGDVDEELELSFADLLDMPLIERRITLTCVSNEVGGPYAGNATWIGVPLADLLRRAGVRDGADALKSTSADGMVIGTPLDAVLDGRDALVALAMNGEPLPLDHGFPARMVVPGLYGYVSATKWLVDLEVTRFADFEAYWTERDWAEQAPIKLASRIDVPRSFQSFDRDSVRVGGVAWAQHVGVRAVEMRVDDGSWESAQLAPQDGIDTWRQWTWHWRDATRGDHTLTVRATDADGTTQTSDRAEPRPDGATGWHSVSFSVE
ncbi:molybdopterin-dependent oxidoreductase [Mumia sp. ZJ1417]|uniref:molybdopterin-dependent oxidoreductase n=1 Tax=Mumia sp. ZJ1417 TaxID=2708082 RepID=UPI00142334A1|nr:molybdopterin-dependent oxidoreductase [Mumia sp. ZJ1417]QMW67548.1 molybdopterin-dependent oxidoreductase [Mumia sp. ZJ1417]